MKIRWSRQIWQNLLTNATAQRELFWCEAWSLPLLAKKKRKKEKKKKKKERKKK
jgi:hypothetical protein